MSKRNKNIKNMGLLRYRGNGVNDDLATFIDDFLGFPFGRTTTYSYHGQWVDTEKYDIVPKASYKEELIEQKKKRLDSLDEEIKKLKSEIEELKKNS